MFGGDKTYFADSPVVIDISGLQWPASSPFNIVHVDVVYNGSVVGNFHADTGGQSSISFDISTALRAIWFGYDFGSEVAAAQAALGASSGQTATRSMREYLLRIHTEYLSSDDGGVFTRTDCGEFDGGQCLIGGLTERERSAIDNKANADVSHWEHTGVRNGDASTKPTTTPERVGSDSITSWTDVQAGQTKTIFYPASAALEDDDVPGSARGWSGHAPLVLRDSQPYVDFLFVNRRGAVETCSGLTLESMGIDVEVQQYACVERPAFAPSRSLMAIGNDGRRSWQMSSGFVSREWAEWWTMEFLGGKRKKWWMRYPLYDPNGRYVPVVVEPAKRSISIYDRSKQEMPHVDFTVTLALEG